MTDTVTLALIAAIPPTMTGIAAVFISLKNHKSVKDLHIAINSRLDQLLAITRAESFAAGVKSEVDRNSK